MLEHLEWWVLPPHKAGCPTHCNNSSSSIMMRTPTDDHILSTPLHMLLSPKAKHYVSPFYSEQQNNTENSEVWWFTQCLRGGERQGMDSSHLASLPTCPPPTPIWSWFLAARAGRRGAGRLRGRRRRRRGASPAKS